MAEKESTKPGSPGAKPKTDKWVKIGAIAGVGVLVLYFISSRKGAPTGQSAASSAAIPMNPYAMSGTVPTGGGSGGAGLATLAEQVGQLQYEVSGAIAPQSSNTPTGSSAVQAPTPTQTNSLPQNPYYAGQVVNAGLNEKIVSSAYDPTLGGGEWLNLTSQGGIYTSGQHALLGAGSYLGLSGAQANQGFSGGRISVGPSGGYTEYNTAGQPYHFAA